VQTAPSFVLHCEDGGTLDSGNVHQNAFIFTITAFRSLCIRKTQLYQVRTALLLMWAILQQQQIPDKYLILAFNLYILAKASLILKNKEVIFLNILTNVIRSLL
jgi:hypothetical protein